MPRGTVIRSVAQIEFTGFRVLERPNVNMGFRILLAVSATAFCIMILAARIIHGDWATAYTAGASFVALAGVLSTWIAWETTKHSAK